MRHARFITKRTDYEFERNVHNFKRSLLPLVCIIQVHGVTMPGVDNMIVSVLQLHRINDSYNN